MERRDLAEVIFLEKKMNKLIGLQPTTEEEKESLKRMFETDTLQGLSQEIIQLRQKLALKAMREPKFRFYSLYSFLCRKDILFAAWKIVKRNGGAPGIDGISIKYLSEHPEVLIKLIEELHVDLCEKKYGPKPIRRCYISKSDGKPRPLGILTVRDRIAQTAAKIVLEPIFEVDFLPCSYGFRPGIGAHDAIKEVESQIKGGRASIYDADLEKYFDGIPHDKLLACVRMRITDSSVLRLLRLWLRAPIVENPNDRSKDIYPKQGVTQGGSLSPVLSNLYLHWFDKAFYRKGGPGQAINAKLIRFADDFVILTRYKATQISEFVRLKIQDWLDLKVNMDKTQEVDLKSNGSELNFLGFQLSYAKIKFGRSYLRIQPSKKSLARAREKVRELTSTSYLSCPPKEVIKNINLFLAGWSNYFAYGHPYDAFTKIDWYVSERLIYHFKRRSQRPLKKGEGISWYETLKKMGLLRVSSREGEAFRKAVCEKFARTV